MGHFVDWLVGQNTKKALNSRFIDWYFKVSEGPWAVLQSTSRYTVEYIDAVFGRTIFRWKYFLFAFSFGVLWGTLELSLRLRSVTHVSFFAAVGKVAPVFFHRSALLLIGLSALLDTVALAASCGIMRRLANAKNAFPVVLLCATFLFVVLFTCIFSFGMPFFFSATLPTAYETDCDSVVEYAAHERLLPDPINSYIDEKTGDIKPVPRRHDWQVWSRRVAPKDPDDCEKPEGVERFMQRFQTNIATAPAFLRKSELISYHSWEREGSLESIAYRVGWEVLLIMFGIPALLSTFVFACILAASTLLVISKPITQKPISILLERLAATPDNVGVFALLTTCLGGIIVFLKALQEALNSGHS